MFLDIAFGIVLALVAEHLGVLMNGNSLTLGPLLVLSVSATLLPDLDGALEFIRRGTIGGKELREHRTMLHRPLFYLPFLILLGAFAGSGIALLFMVGILWHFVHDSYGPGWGYPLLYPFSNRFYKLDRDSDSGRFSIRSWSPQEISTLMSEHGDPDWIRNWYFRMTPTAIVEYGSLIAVLIYLCTRFL